MINLTEHPGHRNKTKLKKRESIFPLTSPIQHLPNKTQKHRQATLCKSKEKQTHLQNGQDPKNKNTQIYYVDKHLRSKHNTCQSTGQILQK